MPMQETQFRPLGQEISYSGIWPPTAILLFGKFHRQRNLAGDNPWGPKELDMTERLSMQGHIMWGYQNQEIEIDTLQAA